MNPLNPLEPVSIDTGLGSVLNQRTVYDEMSDYLRHPPASVPLLDWPIFTKFTGGFRKHEFTILCGPSGKGKTTFLANISAQLLKQNVKHFVMPIETGRQDYMARVISALDAKDHNTGEPVTQMELARISVRYAEVLKNDCIKFSTHENRLSVEVLLEEIETMHSKGCEIAIVDNFNFFQAIVPAHQTIVEMDRVMHEMIMFCKRVPIHVFMVFHPRKLEDGRITSDADIKGSSTAVQEAQNVLFFNPPRFDDIKNNIRSPFDREITIGKMRRRGQYTMRTIVFNNKHTQYGEKEYV